MAQVDVVAWDVICALDDILTVCTELPIKLNVTVEPDCVVVCFKMLVPDNVKFPSKLIAEMVGVAPPLCISKMPAAILKLPLMVMTPTN